MFLSPTQDDGTKVDFPKAVYEMIASTPYSNSPAVNSSISIKSNEKIKNFYDNLYRDA